MLTLLLLMMFQRRRHLQTMRRLDQVVFIARGQEDWRVCYLPDLILTPIFLQGQYPFQRRPRADEITLHAVIDVPDLLHPAVRTRHALAIQHVQNASIQQHRVEQVRALRHDARGVEAAHAFAHEDDFSP